MSDLTIHVTAPGDTVSSIAARYGVPPQLVSSWNGLTNPDRLAVGQSLLILTPTQLHTVQPGESLFAIAGRYGTTVRRLWQLNPVLQGGDELEIGQRLCISVAETPELGELEVLGYAYPFVREQTLRGILPNASLLMPFTYGLAEDGTLVPLQDEKLLALAREYGVAPYLHLSTLTEEGTFSSARAQQALSTQASRTALVNEVVGILRAKGYRGADVDFEYIEGQFAADYAAFIRELRTAVNALGGEVIVALAPKTADDQRGLLYEGHDYAALGAAADGVLLMTYEWGYSYSPPMAVAPIRNVRRVVEYALTRIPAEKIFLGFPNYGYDWTLPIDPEVRARVIGNDEAAALAARERAQIEYDAYAATPHFTYRDDEGAVHEVWFEDGRSANAKYDLVRQYGLRGVGFWNFMRPAAAIFALLAVRGEILQA